LIVNDNKWNKIRISYIASSRTDVWLGTFAAGKYKFYLDLITQSSCQIADLKSSEISTYIQNWPINGENINKNYFVHVMISGIRTSLAKFSIGFDQPLINSKTGVLTVRLNNASRFI
jgi:hypothetical protein